MSALLRHSDKAMCAVCRTATKADNISCLKVVVFISWYWHEESRQTSLNSQCSMQYTASTGLQVAHASRVLFACSPKPVDRILPVRQHCPSNHASQMQPYVSAECCDGTDELGGCKNTCIEKNAAVRESLKQKVEEYKKALAKKKEYSKQAVTKRQDMRSRLAGIDGEIETAKNEVEHYTGEKVGKLGFRI